MRLFLLGFVLGGILAGATTIWIAEERFAALSPVAVVHKLADNSVGPYSDFTNGLRRVLGDEEAARPLRLECQIPEATKLYSIQCRQKMLFELLPSIGRYRTEISICDGVVCGSGLWRF